MIFNSVLLFNCIDPHELISEHPDQICIKPCVLCHSMMEFQLQLNKTHRQNDEDHDCNDKCTKYQRPYNTPKEHELLRNISIQEIRMFPEVIAHQSPPNATNHY